MRRNMTRMFILACMAFLFIGVVNAQAVTEDPPESEEAEVLNQEDNKIQRGALEHKVLSEERRGAKKKLQKSRIAERKAVKEKLRNASQVATSTGTDKFTDEEWKRLTKEGGKEIEAFNKSLEEERHEFQAGLKKERKAFFESTKDLKDKERGKAISGFNQRQKEKRQAFHQAQKEKRKAFIKKRKAAKAGVRKERKGKKAELRLQQKKERKEKKTELRQQKKERKQFHKKSPKRRGGPPKGKGPALQGGHGNKGN